MARTRDLAESNVGLAGDTVNQTIAEARRGEMLQRLVKGQEQERGRIARDIHDHLGQRLTALRLKISSLHELCGDNTELMARVTRLQQIAEMLDSEVSFLAWELRPTALDELGLIEAIGTFVKEWSRHYGIVADFHPARMVNVPPDHEVATHLYRILQEALNNIVKHAQAENVNVVLERVAGKIILIIEDDGIGFSRDRRKKDRPGDKTSLGLIGMGERAELMDGSLEIESARGKGTTIYVRVPIMASEGKHDRKIANTNS